MSCLPGSSFAGTPLVLEARKVQEEEVKLDSISRSRGLCEGGRREPTPAMCPAQGGPQRTVTFCLRSRSIGWCLGLEKNPPAPNWARGREEMDV